jgi:hypothetical protein
MRHGGTDAPRSDSQDIARSAWLLPPYALRKAEDGAASLRLQLQAALSTAKPRKRFGFSARSKGPADAATPSAAAAAQPAVQHAVPHTADTGAQPVARPDRLVPEALQLRCDLLLLLAP